MQLRLPWSRRSLKVAASALQAGLIAVIGGCASNSNADAPALVVPSWLVARAGTSAIFDDEHMPCGPNARRLGYLPSACGSERVVTIVDVTPSVFPPIDPEGDSDMPFLDAAVIVNDSGKRRRVRGSDLSIVIPNGTNVPCPKTTWWNPPPESFYGARGETDLVTPVTIRLGKRFLERVNPGQAILVYELSVLDGDHAGEHGTTAGASYSCEPADRPGVKMQFHFDDAPPYRPS